MPPASPTVTWPNISWFSTPGAKPDSSTSSRKPPTEISSATIPNERWAPRMERKSGCEATLFSAAGAGGICPGGELYGPGGEL
ncbi:hypothetical protein GCM10010094_61230 [Streptomyces flaveus]|uniref:Uncharacterized protein n=1 Tax=Streptomyces flaveus TaxID=66370 RepID=A0A917R6A4_9ACTN|nr:hypothetical protein GCM10010094_61230 [Streptomyces flaveus]